MRKENRSRQRRSAAMTPNRQSQEDSMQVLSRQRSLPRIVAPLFTALCVAFYGVATLPTYHASHAAGTNDSPPPANPAPVVSCEPPADVAIPAGPEATVSELASFDDLSWRTFVALNWPAIDGKRGVPDPEKKLGDRAPAVVWETWKAAYEVFQPDGKPPSEWDSFTAISPCKEVANADAGRAKQLLSYANFGSVLEDFNEGGFGEVPIGPLIAQNRTYVRYEIHMNQPHYNYLRGDPSDCKSARYRRDNLPPKGPAAVFPAGSIEVKAAWRQFRLPDEKDLLNRYYHVEARLVDRQTGSCVHQTMGLVGLHILHKTPTRPQWVWSTFEHVDNVAIGPCAPKGLRPTFNNPDGPQMGDEVNKLPQPISKQNPPVDNPDPVQVVRLNPMNESTRKTNDLYHGHRLVKDTVWKYYDLVATQWPTDPKTGGTGKPFPPSRVANATMETRFQSISCLSCHGLSQDTDFSWVLAVRAYPTSEQTASNAVKALQEIQKK
jgi:hypothetical protein